MEKMMITIPCESKATQSKIAKELQAQGFERVEEIYWMNLWKKDNVTIVLEVE